jgi:uncharacterized protein YkwD
MRALYVSAMAMFIAIFGIIYLFRIATSGATVEPQVLGENVTLSSNSLDQKEIEIIAEINKLRSGVGVGEISYDNNLKKITEFRISDMINRDYYSHNTPEGLTYANYMSEYVPSSTFSCENLQLQTGDDAIEAYNAWVNSPSHKKCLTSPKITKVAISNSRHGEPLYSSDNQTKQLFVFALIASN